MPIVFAGTMPSARGLKFQVLRFLLLCGRGDPLRGAGGSGLFTPEPELTAAASQALAEPARRRRQGVEMIGMEANRLRQARDPRVRRMIRATSKTLEAQRAKLDREIKDTVRGSPVRRAADDLLISAPGIGEVTARTPIADRPELGQLD